MKLGEKLRDIIRDENRAKFEAARKERDAEDQRRAVVRRDRTQLIDRIKESFIHQIKNNRKPSYRIAPTDFRSWVNRCQTQAIWSDKDIWVSFLIWLDSEDLLVKITEEHDGVGIESWLVVGAEPCIRGSEVSNYESD